MTMLTRARCGTVIAYGRTPAQAEQMLKAALDSGGQAPVNGIELTAVTERNPNLLVCTPKC